MDFGNLKNIQIKYYNVKIRKYVHLQIELVLVTVIIYVMKDILEDYVNLATFMLKEVARVIRKMDI